MEMVLGWKMDRQPQGKNCTVNTFTISIHKSNEDDDEMTSRTYKNT